MNIRVTYAHWGWDLAVTAPEFTWTKVFSTPVFDEMIFEQALGYILALEYVRRYSDGITINYNGIDYSYQQFISLPIVRSYILTPPIYQLKVEPLNAYLNRHNIVMNKRYLMIFDSRPFQVGLIQFDHPALLQGVVSILRAFNEATVDHIHAIYDFNGVSYKLIFR